VVTSDTQTVLNLYSDSSCCSQVEKIKLGNLDTSHDVNGGFAMSFWQQSGKGHFTQNPPIHVFFFTGKGCTGQSFKKINTNGAMCESLSGYASFKISATGTGSGNTGLTGASCRTASLRQQAVPKPRWDWICTLDPAVLGLLSSLQRSEVSGYATEPTSPSGASLRMWD
jgi:hypothetical protein